MANPEIFPEKDNDAQWGDTVKKHDGRDRVWTGIILVIAGGALLARSFNVPLPTGLFSWQSFLIMLGILTGIRNKFEDASWFILVLIGTLFLVNDYYVDLQLRKRLWPLILIIIGLFFVFRARMARGGRRIGRMNGDYEKDRALKGDSNFADVFIIFSGANKRLISKNFAGGNITVIFGGAKIDLLESDIQEAAVINFTAIGCGAELFIPSDWTVKSQLTNILSVIKDRREQSSLLPEDPKKVLILEGTAMFAGIEIKNFEK